MWYAKKQYYTQEVAFTQEKKNSNQLEKEPKLDLMLELEERVFKISTEIKFKDLDKTW